MRYGTRLWAVLLIIAMILSMGMTAMATEEQELTPEEQAEEEEKQRVYALPAQTADLTGWPEGPSTYGEAAIVMEAGTGAILYAKNIDTSYYPASITKILTALVAMENGNFGDPVSFSPDSVSFLEWGDAQIGMKEGNVITLEQALYAVLLASANEVSYAVGESVGKNAGYDYNWFIEQMNARCQQLGGMNSHFSNPHGLHNDDHYTCARDMALITREAFKHPEIFTIMQTLQYRIDASDTTEEHVFQQNHKMLFPQNPNYYEYAIGGKTGYTSDALSTLVTMADNGSMQLVCVVLKTHGVNIYPDTKNLLEYAFTNFGKASVAENESSEDVAEVLNAPDADTRIILPNGVDFGDLEREIIPDSESVSEGTIEYRYGGNLLGSARVALSQSYMDMLSASPEEEEIPPQTEDSKAEGEADSRDEKGLSGVLDFLQEKSFTEKCILGGAGALLVILMIVLTAVVSVRRKRKRKKRKTS